MSAPATSTCARTSNRRWQAQVMRRVSWPCNAACRRRPAAGIRTAGRNRARSPRAWRLCAVRRGGFGHAHLAADEPRLAADFGDVPAVECGDPAGERHHRQCFQCRAVAIVFPDDVPRRPPRHGDHQEARTDHDAKRPEHRRHWRVPPFKLVQALHYSVRVVGEDEARTL